MSFRPAGELLNRLISSSWRAIKPNDWFEAAWDYGPDIAFAARAGMTAPEGWKAALAGEDLALGLGASMAGRIGGDMFARKVLGLNPAVLEDMRRIHQARNMGSLALSYGPALAGFRPVTDAMIKQQEEEYAQQQELGQEEQLKHTQEALLGSAIGGLGAARTNWNIVPGINTMA